MITTLDPYSSKINDYFFSLKDKIKPKKPNEIRDFVDNFYKNRRFEKFINKTEDIFIKDLKMRLYKSENISKNCVIYIHGGGFVFGDLEHVDYFVSELCYKIGVDVYSLDYKKAPEYLYPEAHNNILYLINHILESENKYDSFYLMGCSAGAMLALHSLKFIRIKDKIKGLILDSPAINTNSTSDSFQAYSKGFFLDKRSFDYYMNLYFRDQKIEIDLKSLNEIKNILIISCDYDPLKDQSFELEEKIRKEYDINLKHYHIKKQLHGFCMLYYSFDIGLEELPHWEYLNEFIRK
jgi:acetyl esterase